MLELSNIETKRDFAVFFKIPYKKLTFILYVKKPDSYYRSFKIPKKDGSHRIINAPTGDLKEFQRIISEQLSIYRNSIWRKNKTISNISHAFEKNKSIFTNAAIHRNKLFVLNVDLEDFFDSFHFGRVCGFFEKNKFFSFSHEVAVVMSQLVCYQGKLPQGAPSSPIITNMICQILDMKVLKVAKKYRLDYTRYADDLTFSTNNKSFIDECKSFFDELRQIIKKEGFSINEKKTRLQYNDSKQIVTGLVVNKKINVDRSYYRETKAMADHLYKCGEFTINDKPATINRLEGRFTFINQIDKYNNIINKDSKKSFRSLNGREKQYKKFLFYRYFFANDKPLIMTEGKTDPRYIKAALKHLYLEYPELVTKNENGSFEFKISFFRRSKRFEFLFGMGVDGADALKQLCFCYGSIKKGAEQGYIDCYQYFTDKCNHKPINPVILILDNELANKNKPISKLINIMPVKEKKNIEEAIRAHLMSKLTNDSNLFLVTNPLVGDKDECEIEDLFDAATRGHIIDGKHFSRDKDYDITKYYGKEIFSKYIEKNYESIDFTAFKPMLDSISKIVSKYKKDK